MSGRSRLGITYFHNEFTNGAQNVPQFDLGHFGVPATLAAAFSLRRLSQWRIVSHHGLGVLKAECQASPHLFARGGYTYTDAVVQQSIATPADFTSFPNIPIGAYAPLPGARPFRIAPHTGYFAISYTRSKFYASLSGTLVGKRDDSDFLTDSNFGNGLLLPNRNLLGSYERLQLGGGISANATPQLICECTEPAQRALLRGFRLPFPAHNLPDRNQTKLWRRKLETEMTSTIV